MQILDGKIVSQSVKDLLKTKTAALKAAGKKNTAPGGNINWQQWRQRNLCGQQSKNLRRNRL
ncbi:MAG: hypothetical protein WDM90_10420 [Ferruginibacter sp.]